MAKMKKFMTSLFWENYQMEERLSKSNSFIQYDFYFTGYTFFIIYCTDQYRCALKSQEVNADYRGESVMYLTKS